MVLRELVSPDITGNTQHYHKLFSLLIQRKHRHKDVFMCTPQRKGGLFDVELVFRCPCEEAKHVLNYPAQYCTSAPPKHVDPQH